MNRYTFSSVLLILVGFGQSNSVEKTKNRSFGDLLKNCSPNSSSESSGSKEFVDILRNCMQRRALIAMDALLSNDVIPVVQGIDLVRFKTNSKNSTDPQQTKKEKTIEGRESEKSWGSIVLGRFSRIFRTHVLKIDVDQLSYLTSNEANLTTSHEDNVVQGRRRRRRRHQMMPMLMMGVLIMGSVLIPMGFQFLAVLGGKALILAKLALMLSSIQGLKKIATNGVNYGLYHSPEGWHERSHQASPLGHFEIPYQIYPPHSQP